MSDSPETENLPAITEEDLKACGFPSGVTMAPGLALFLNEKIYDRGKQIARLMSDAQGFMPNHLVGKPAACFAVVSLSITWNLSPYMVARATYQTPGGSIGFMGVLVSAILENSGRLEGGLKYTFEGNWDQVKGKYAIKDSQKGGKYAVPTWTREDAKGLAVIVSAKVKGEPEPRSLRFDLDEAFPLNSPLWATGPQRQICYTAARAFANIAMPGLLMGVPFDIDPNDVSEPMRDITPPRPERDKNEFTRRPKPEQTNPAATVEPEPPADPQPDPATHEQGDPADQQQPEEQAQADPEKPTFEIAKSRLLNCARVSEVADLRKEVSAWLDRELHGEWEKLCDARTNKLVDAMSRPATRAKR